MHPTFQNVCALVTREVRTKFADGNLNHCLSRVVVCCQRVMQTSTDCGRKRIGFTGALGWYILKVKNVCFSNHKLSSLDDNISFMRCPSVGHFSEVGWNFDSYFDHVNFSWLNMLLTWGHFGSQRSNLSYRLGQFSYHVSFFALLHPEKSLHLHNRAICTSTVGSSESVSVPFHCLSLVEELRNRTQNVGTPVSFRPESALSCHRFVIVSRSCTRLDLRVTRRHPFHITICSSGGNFPSSYILMDRCSTSTL